MEASNRESRAGSRSSRLPCIDSRLRDDVMLLDDSETPWERRIFWRMIEAAWRTDVL